jgi:hypothetical protein
MCIRRRRRDGYRSSSAEAKDSKNRCHATWLIQAAQARHEAFDVAGAGGSADRAAS